MPEEKRQAEDAATGDNAISTRVRVLLPLPLRGAYDYAVPANMALVPGNYVRVPLGNREVDGVVWGEGTGEVAEEKLKPVLLCHQLPAMPKPQRALIDWISSYTLSSPGTVLRMALSVPEALEPPKPATGYRLSAFAPDLRMTPTRQRAMDALASNGDETPMTAGHLRDDSGVSHAVIKGLEKAGVLETVPIFEEAVPFDTPDPDADQVDLNKDQAVAATALTANIGQGYHATVLEGVTGSGKTEVYFEAIAEALRQDLQSVVLLPEIALSAQWLDRFQTRFGVVPAVWHSDLTRKQRRETWRAVALGNARVVVGARSALFLPFGDLGLIVVDEEHESSFKQEDGVVYHARDMAVVRAHLGEIPAILASATPSLETVANVERDRYEHLILPHRHGGAQMPDIKLVDMRKEPPPSGHWLSNSLKEALTETMAAQEQAMLFLNRRGYAPLTLCRTCGHRIQCAHCTAWMVEHRLAGRLECHHCGITLPIPETCPECGDEESLVPCGPGIERLAEEVAGLFPDARIAMMASDTVHGPEAAAEMVRRVRDREVDLLIGTQIVAKGHHFPMLTLVGVVDADLGLSGGDLRASERTWQLMNQVAGRAGRAERPGRVLLQSWMPEHPVLEAIAAGDKARFVEEEMAAREFYAMPPYGRLAGIIISGRDLRAVEMSARSLARSAPAPNQASEVQVFGPAPAPLSVLRGRHRARLLVKANRNVNLQAFLRRWLAMVQWPSSVRVKVDIDPYSFL